MTLTISALLNLETAPCAFNMCRYLVFGLGRRIINRVALGKLFCARLTLLGLRVLLIRLDRCIRCIGVVLDFVCLTFFAVSDLDKSP